MKDYIEREAVIKGFTDLLQKPGDIYPTDITTMMQSVPAADVRPVVRGEWIDPEDIVCYKCSSCGKSTNWERPDVPFQFCPRCGSYNGGDGDDQH